MSGGLASIAQAPLAAAGAVGDYQAAAGAKKAQKKQIKKTQQVYMDSLGRTQGLYAKGAGYQKKAIDVLGKGTNDALGIAARVGSAASQRVLDREQGLLGSAQQDAVSRGLYNSTAPQGANRAIRADTERSLAQIMDSIAGLQSGITQQGAGAQANALQNMATFYQGQSQQEQEIMRALAEYLGGIQHIAGPSILGSLGGLSKLGLQMGGPGGGNPTGPGGAATSGIF